MTELWNLPAGDILHHVTSGEVSTRLVARASRMPNKATTPPRAEQTWTEGVTYPDDRRNDAGNEQFDSPGAWSDAGDRMQSGKSPVSQRGLPLLALRRAIHAIHVRLGEKLALQDIADAACMSRFHFARLFRRSTGYSPMEYLLHARLEQAKALLRQRAMPISDIAAEIGFADQSHLTRHFRRAVGMTPLQYARRCVDALASATHAVHDQ